MKKILLLFMAVLLIVFLAVPAFATGDYGEFEFNGVVLPSTEELDAYRHLLERDSGWYVTIARYRDLSGFRYVLIAGMAPMYVNEYGNLTHSEQQFDQYGFQYWIYTVSSSSWSEKQEYFVPAFSPFYPFLLCGEAEIVWDNYSVCDGSTCPATDVNMDNVCDDCGFPFAFPSDYPPEPFTVTKFMNHIGQILTSAVSWVSDVGAAILAQPLLLAFTVLPLCGLGIAVFRRLKNTV